MHFRTQLKSPWPLLYISDSPNHGRLQTDWDEDAPIVTAVFAKGSFTSFLGDVVYPSLMKPKAQKFKRRTV